MTMPIGLDKWIFTLVEKHPNNEYIIGQYDTEHDIQFIPVFLNRNTAQLGVRHLAIDTNYEIQAIIYEDLLQYAMQHQSLIFVLDEQGLLLIKIGPDGRVLSSG